MPYAATLPTLLVQGQVLGHPFIKGELLMGSVGNGRQQLLSDYELLAQAAAVEHSEVEEFVHRRRLNGRGIGWIDAHLLASSLVENALFWTADARLQAIAIDLGITY